MEVRTSIVAVITMFALALVALAAAVAFLLWPSVDPTVAYVCAAVMGLIALLCAFSSGYMYATRERECTDAYSPRTAQEIHEAHVLHDLTGQG